SLRVEVPINAYPTKQSLSKAMEAFAGAVARVELLSEMSAGDEAMQLYDLEVEGVGRLRVVEHFTVAAGRIVRLRQSHDTAPLRSAPDEGSYRRGLLVAAPPSAVYEALTTLEGIAGWWTPLVEGVPTAGGQIRLVFASVGERIVMRVLETRPETAVK